MVNANYTIFQKRGHSKEKWIQKEIDLYAQVYANLKLHHSGYPSPEHLKSVIYLGNENTADLHTAPADMITKDTAASVKPTLDSEPSYENTPHGLHNAEEPYWNADDVRRYAYWSVFAGACGHTYGENSVRQVYQPRDTKPSSGAKGYFKERLSAPGSQSMQHLKILILSRPYFDRVNDQSIVVDEGEKYDRVIVTKGEDYVMAYVYSGREFKLRLGRISGTEVIAWWYNPRTGEATKLNIFKNEGEKSFDPPGEKANGNDWVLLLDNASKSFRMPGKL